MGCASSTPVMNGDQPAAGAAGSAPTSAAAAMADGLMGQARSATNNVVEAGENALQGNYYWM